MLKGKEDQEEEEVEDLSPRGLRSKKVEVPSMVRMQSSFKMAGEG